MNAIVEISGKQYKITKDQELLVDKLPQESKKIKIDKVLMAWDNTKIEFGNPYLKNSFIEAELLGDAKGKKITIIKHKAKKRYRKKIGVKPQFSKIKITKIKI